MLRTGGTLGAKIGSKVLLIDIVYVFDLVLQKFHKRPEFMFLLFFTSLRIFRSASKFKKNPEFFMKELISPKLMNDFNQGYSNIF